MLAYHKEASCTIGEAVLVDYVHMNRLSTGLVVEAHNVTNFQQQETINASAQKLVNLEEKNRVLEDKVDTLELRGSRLARSVDEGNCRVGQSVDGVKSTLDSFSVMGLAAKESLDSLTSELKTRGEDLSSKQIGTADSIQTAGGDNKESLDKLTEQLKNTGASLGTTTSAHTIKTEEVGTLLKAGLDNLASTTEEALKMV